MSASKEIRQLRCDDTLVSLLKGGKCVFFTLTTPDVVDIKEMRRRWRGLRNWLVRRLGNPHYVMNYEVHPQGHGWHIHAVFNRFIPLRELLPKIRAYGFGRVDVRPVNNHFVANYLTKHCLKAYRGLSKRLRNAQQIHRLRLVNASRGLPVLSDYRQVSDFRSKVLALYRQLNPPQAFRMPVYRSLVSKIPVSLPILTAKCEPYYMYIVPPGVPHPSRLRYKRPNPYKMRKFYSLAVAFATMGVSDISSGYQILRKYTSGGLGGVGYHPGRSMQRALPKASRPVQAWLPLTRLGNATADAPISGRRDYAIYRPGLS